jgi:taurine--2-oxoglutarate transaminase
MLKRKISMMGWVSHLLVAPPLIVTEEQIDETVAALDAALAIADAKVA